jgi:hypothetical protein
MKKKMKIYIESINTFELKGLTIRFWRKQIKGYNNPENQRELFKHLFKIKAKHLDYREVAEHCIKLKGVNAVEVKYSNNTGIVLYKNWP